MTAKLKASVSLLALGVALASGSALAYEKGDIVLRAGAAMVDPDGDSSVLNAGGSDVPGTSVSVDDNTQLGLTGLYMLSNNVGVELLAATPFSHTVTAHDIPNVGQIDVADVKHLPPTVSVQYFPMSSDSAFQPYLGVGLNYTIFFDEEATSVFEAATSDDSISVDVDDSFGLAFQLGCDYAISDNLVVNAAVWMIDIDTSATIKTDSAFGEINVDVDIDPMAYMIGLGYKF
jgi:outer membrane protein